MDVELLVRSLVFALMLAVTYSLVALGLTLVFGIMDIVNFAHGEMYMLGGFAAYYFFGVLGLNYGLTLLIAVLLAGVIGIIIERLVIRPFRGLMNESFIATLALAMLLQFGAFAVFGGLDKTVTPTFPGVLTLGSLNISTQRVAVSIIGIVLILALYFFIQRSRIGRAMRAVAQDKDAASLQGVNVNSTCAIGMAIGCALGAAAGVLMAPIFLVNPYMGTPFIFKAFVIVVLGGLGSIPGAILGAVILALIESLGSTFVGSSMATMLAFIGLVIVLLVRPSGLLRRA